MTAFDRLHNKRYDWQIPLAQTTADIPKIKKEDQKELYKAGQYEPLKLSPHFPIK